MGIFWLWLRHQCCPHTAFTLTSYACQGQTIPKVLADLTIPGSGAYVQASRAQTCYDFFSIFPVTFTQLSKPHSLALKKEDLCLNALAHNSLIYYNFISGSMIPIPDFESEQGIITTKPKSMFEINDTRKQLSKRKKGSTDSSDVDRSGIHTIFNSGYLQGCVWDASKWSCAYDAVVMTFFPLHSNPDVHWKVEWSTQSIISNQLGNDLQNLNMEQYSINDINAVRNALYSTLVSENPHLFPPQPVPIAVSDIFQYLYSSAQLQAISLFCENHFEPNNIPTFFPTALNNSS